MMLTTAEYVVLRQLEATPGLLGMCAGDLIDRLRASPYALPRATVYAVCRRLMDFGAIQVCDEQHCSNGKIMRWYGITESGMNDLTEWRTWLGDTDG
jgi:hypothetical protein